MNLEIKIDDERITELVELAIVDSVIKNHSYLMRDAQFGVKSGVDKAVKEYIYKNKDRIIERVVERASVEIVKKGLPKLLESLGKGVRDE
jgi:hypothetical protein